MNAYPLISFYSFECIHILLLMETSFNNNKEIADGLSNSSIIHITRIYQHIQQTADFESIIIEFDGAAALFNKRLKH